MGAQLSSASVKTEKPEEKPQEEKKLKPCCACPETKRARDAW